MPISVLVRNCVLKFLLYKPELRYIFILSLKSLRHSFYINGKVSRFFCIKFPLLDWIRKYLFVLILDSQRNLSTSVTQGLDLCVYLLSIMPNSKRNHEESRRFVCFLCLNKNLEGKLIKEEYKKQISSTLYPDFYKDESFLPSGLCSPCCRIINSQKTSKPRKYPGI